MELRCIAGQPYRPRGLHHRDPDRATDTGTPVP